MRGPDARQRGFTIVELMIATMVFGVILLGVTAAITTMGKKYQRSMYASNTQAVTSNLVDTLSQAVRYTSGMPQKGGNPLTDTGSYCIGEKQILYAQGMRLGDTAAATSSRFAVLVRSGDSTCSTIPSITQPLSIPGEYQELLGRGMRISKLDIFQQSDGSFKVEARVVYGEDDLLCSESVANSCRAGEPYLNASQLRSLDNLQCKPGPGSEYCSASELSATVYQRL